MKKIDYYEISKQKFLESMNISPYRINSYAFQNYLKKLPKVIDNIFIKNKISQIKNLKHKSILTLTYSVGLRVSEVVNLKIEYIDSKKMLITIKNSKDGKDRIVPLSSNVLELLRRYYKEYKPKEYELYTNVSNDLLKKVDLPI